MGVIHHADRSNSSDAFRLAVAQYLEELHSYSSSSSSSSSDFQADEYNVGAVISAVAPLRRSFEVSIDSKALLRCLVQSWYLSIEKEAQDIDPDMIRNHFNEDYDLDGSLNLIIASYLVEISSSLEVSERSVLQTCSDLLIKYSLFLNPKAQQTTIVTLSQLQSKFHDLYTILKFQTQENIEKAIELRREGNEYAKTGKTASAIVSYTRALDLDPSNHIIYSNRAAIYAQLNHHECAIEDLKKAVALEPNYETAWTRLAFSYLGKANGIDSIKAYVKAIQLAETNNSLPRYIKKLIDSVHYAGQRVLSQGRTQEEVTTLLEPVKDIIEKYKDVPSMRTRPTAASGSVPVSASGSIPNSAQSNIPYTAFANPAGTRANTVQQFVLPDGSISTGTFDVGQLFGATGNNAGTANAATAAAANTNTTTTNATTFPLPNGTTTHSFVINTDGSRGNMSDAIHRGIEEFLHSVNGQQQNQQQQQQQQDQQQGPNSNATGSSSSQDQEMPDEISDPETTLPQEQPQSQQAGPAPAPTPSNNVHVESILANLFAGALPESMRSSVGPLIINATNHYVMNRDAQQQHQSNNQNHVGRTFVTSSTSTSTSTNSTNTNSTNSNNNTSVGSSSTNLDNEDEDYDLD